MKRGVGVRREGVKEVGCTDGYTETVRRGWERSDASRAYTFKPNVFVSYLVWSSNSTVHRLL